MKSIDEMSFEEAFSELEEVLKDLESGDHSLEDSVKYYEKGQELIKRCSDLLQKAELRVRVLSGNEIVDE